jgi:hypothetical protein
VSAKSKPNIALLMTLSDYNVGTIIYPTGLEALMSMFLENPMIPALGLIPVCALINMNVKSVAPNV